MSASVRTNSGFASTAKSVPSLSSRSRRRVVMTPSPGPYSNTRCSLSGTRVIILRTAYRELGMTAPTCLSRADTFRKEMMSMIISRGHGGGPPTSRFFELQFQEMRGAGHAGVVGANQFFDLVQNFGLVGVRQHGLDDAADISLHVHLVLVSRHHHFAAGANSFGVGLDQVIQRS